MYSTFPSLLVHESGFTYRSAHYAAEFVLKHNFCVTHGTCLFQASFFCVHKGFINETPGVAVVSILVLAHSALHTNTETVLSPNNYCQKRSFSAFGCRRLTCGHKPDIRGQQTVTFLTLSRVDQSEVLTGAYREIAPWFNWRPVAVAGPSRVALPQTNPNTYRASLEQHGDVCCMSTDKLQIISFLTRLPTELGRSTKT